MVIIADSSVHVRVHVYISRQVNPVYVSLFYYHEIVHADTSIS